MITWRIDWHEGPTQRGPDGQYRAPHEGRTFGDEVSLRVALREIGRDPSLKSGGYNKTHLSMLDEDGATVLWSERLDLNDWTGEDMDAPRGVWTRCRDFYRGPVGQAYAHRCGLDAAGRAAYYDALLRDDLPEVRRLIAAGAMGQVTT